MKMGTTGDGGLSILFDASILGYSLLKRQYKTGIYRVAISLLREFTHRRDVKVVVYTSSGNRELCRLALRRAGLRGLPLAGIPLLYDLAFSAMVVRNLLMRAAARVPRLLASVLGLIKTVPDGLFRALCLFRRVAEKRLLQQVDAYFSPMEAAPLWIRSVTNLRRYTILHDLIPLLHSDYSINPHDPTKWFPRFLASLGQEDRLFAVSEHTKKDFLKLFSVIPEDQITPVYNAVDEATFYPGVSAARRRTVLCKYGIPENSPVFLSVSTLELRKRLDAVLAAFGEFCRSGFSGTLVLCGPNRQHYQSKLMRQIEKTARSSVVFTDFVPDSDLRVLYCSCRAFLYLSEYEGFGLPVLEAMACGAPVIVADRTSLPEVVGDAGFLVDPDDSAAVVEIMQKLVVDEELWGRSADRSRERAAKFSWRRCADVVISRIYDDRLSCSA
jgi:glycosyltransferase involved in cell wall biosynthesis